jgi:hypothetical protein
VSLFAQTPNSSRVNNGCHLGEIFNASDTLNTAVIRRMAAQSPTLTPFGVTPIGITRWPRHLPVAPVLTSESLDLLDSVHGSLTTTQAKLAMLHLPVLRELLASCIQGKRPDQHGIHPRPVTIIASQISETAGTPFAAGPASVRCAARPVLTTRTNRFHSKVGSAGLS